MKRSPQAPRKTGARSLHNLVVRRAILFVVIAVLLTGSIIVPPAVGSTNSPAGKGWIQISGPGPSPRWTHSMVLDRKRQEAVVFGGFGGGREVWIFSFAARKWTRVDVANGPTPRASPAAIADFARDRMVVVGGLYNGRLFDDVWAFSFATRTWSQLPKGPSPRFDMGAVTDGVHAWFYGGFLPKLKATDELWQLDLATDTWTLLPQSKTRPSPRTNMGIGLYHGSMYVIGGHDAKGITPGTWRYDFSSQSWTQLSPAGKPGAGAHFASATDNICAQLFLAGGDHDDNVDVDTTDRFLFLNPAFIRLATTRNFPARRHGALVLEPRTRTLLLFGGIHDPKQRLGDTWFYQLGRGCTP